MEQKILETIKKYDLIKDGEKIVIGVSGGPDSISLLNALKNIKQKMNFEIIAVHINHQIREEANSDEEYVQNIASYDLLRSFEFMRAIEFSQMTDISVFSKLKQMNLK